MKNLLVCLLLLVSLVHAQPLRVTHLAPVAPDILGVTIEQGKVEYATQTPYQKQPGDEVIESPNYGPRWIKRGGKTIGALVGPKNDVLYNFDKVVGDKLDTAWADKAESYSLASPDDNNFQNGRAPVAVYRKSKPIDYARMDGWKFDWPLRHVLYLRLPSPLQSGQQYQLKFNGASLENQEFIFDRAKQRSEAIHISQIGFRPDDPAKVAFLSCWLGNGGKLSYVVGTPFQVVEDATRKAVFEGKIVLSKAADAKDEDPYKNNYNATDVYLLDFSALNKPGRYRVVVDGIGCSYPFEIGSDVWRNAFYISARGLYHQRSGIELGPPFTEYKRPRSFHPADGVRVYHSTTPLMDSGNGLNAKGTDKGNFQNLVAGKTDEIVPDAWGGYMDAGDWDRRIQHLEATNLLLELYELFPEQYSNFNLNLPESKNELPDVIDEALWNIDFYRRLMTPEGGVRGGIESAEHPRYGEASWQESLPIMAYAPDAWCSFLYAASAARVAAILEKRWPEKAQIYRDSALKAMTWAEAEYSKTKEQKLPHQVADARNLAAVSLFALTGEARWHEIFLATTVFTDAKSDPAIWAKHHQRDAAFIYARLQPGVNENVRANARAAMEREAQTALKFGENTAFKWTKHNPWEPVSYGKLSVPQALTLARTHYLTNKPEYLRTIVLASQYGAGANPVNISYTTGVGIDSVKHPLVLDQRITLQAPPPGITVFGPTDTSKIADHWLVKQFAADTFPAPQLWPTTEAYFDVYHFPEVNEYVVGTIGSNAYVWGYLAARK